MLSAFYEPIPHTNSENQRRFEQAESHFAHTLSAVFENGQSSTFTGQRAFGRRLALYRRRKKPLTTTTNKRTDPPFPRRDENETSRNISAEIFAKIAGTHGLSFSPADEKRALRVAKDRWRRGAEYIGASTALGATPTVAITLNWQSLAAFSDADLVHEPVDLITAKFIRRLYDWCRRQGLRPSFVWSAATGARYGAHCHVVAHVPADHQQAFFSWLARTTGDPTDLTRSNQSAVISDFGGWYVTFVHPAGVADAVCYVCVQSLKHLPSAFDPKKCFGVSLSKK